MSDRIDPVLVEKAQEAYEQAQRALKGPRPMEAALSVVFDGLRASGLREALVILSRVAKFADRSTSELPYFYAINALIHEIARREGVSKQDVIAELKASDDESSGLPVEQGDAE